MIEGYGQSWLSLNCVNGLSTIEGFQCCKMKIMFLNFWVIFR